MTNENTLYKRLYKLNTNGSTQVWEIHRNNNSYWSVSGKLDGKMIVNEPTLVTPKQKRTLDEQVEFYCESQINKKKDKKYVEDLKDIHIADDDLPAFSCTLAKKYEDHKQKLKGKRLSISPKLDGVRCLSEVSGIFSRGRKQFTSCQHIQKELEDFFKRNPEAQLDGELYTNIYKNDFEKIVSSVKKTAEKATQKDIEFQKKIEYWLFDARRIGILTENDSFEDRLNLLEKKIKQGNYKYLKLVPTIHGVNEDKILEMKEKWTQEGYEGLMCRVSNSVYEGKRTDNLLKLKSFEDKEFEILDIREGNGKLTGHAGSFVFKSKNGTFEAKMKGSLENLKYLFEHPNECIGKLGTVRFQNLTDSGIPRFPVCIGIRDYE